MLLCQKELLLANFERFIQRTKWTSTPRTLLTVFFTRMSTALPCAGIDRSLSDAVVAMVARRHCLATSMTNAYAMVPGSGERE
jgi:hypothetical protein